MSDRRGEQERQLRERAAGLLRGVGAVGRRVLPEFVRRRYTAKFALSMVLVVLLISVIGGVGVTQIQSSLTEDRNDQLTSRASMQATAVSGWVESMRVQTRYVSRATPIETGSTTAMNNYLQTAQDSGTLDIVGIHVVNRAQGAVTSSTTFEMRGRSLSRVEQPWTTQLETVETYAGVSSVVVTSQAAYQRNGETVLAFVSPVPNRDRVVVFVSSIQRQIDSFGGNETGVQTTIVHGDGEVVLAPGGTRGSGENGTAGEQEGAATSSDGSTATLSDGSTAMSSDERAVASITNTSAFTAAAENSTVGSATASGEVLGYAAVPQTDWVLVTSLETSEAYAISRSAGQTVLLVVLGSVLSLGTVATVLGWGTIVPLRRLRRRAEQMQNGDLDVSLSTRRTDEIGQLFDSFDEMRQSLREQLDETEAALREAREAREQAETARAQAESARDEARGLSQKLRNRAEAYGETMQACADGELYRRLETDVDSEAMAEIATAFNGMMDDIEATLAEVRSFASDVETASREVADGTSDVERRSREVTERVDEISAGAADQSDRLESMSAETGTLSANVEEIAASVSAVADSARTSVDRGEEGRAAAEAALAEMETLRERADETAAQMAALDEQVTAIGDTAAAIADIADQTDMLALNANIEAANADGDSAGFAVVAEEVKALAEETSEATDEISDRIEAVQSQTDQTNAVVDQMQTAVDDATATVDDVLAALDDIRERVEETERRASDIDQSTDEQARATQQVAADIDDLSEISQEVSDTAEAVADTAAEQSQTLTDVTSQTAQLRDRAERLSEQLATFETRRDDGEGADQEAPGVALDDTTAARDGDAAGR